MEEFENLQGFLEHISLVMDNERGAADDAVSVMMTMHSAKGLEFDTVFLPGWEEGVFPNQRALDDQGRAGLEEERRLAHVGLTRARKRAKILFRHQPAHARPVADQHSSRFLDELPEANVEGHGIARRLRRVWRLRRFAASMPPPRSANELRHPRLAARPRANGSGRRRLPPKRKLKIYDGDDDFLRPARQTPRHWLPRPPHPRSPSKASWSPNPPAPSRRFSIGDRVFHTRNSGNGNVSAVDGNKLTIQFDRAGEKRVVDSFVERV